MNKNHTKGSCQINDRNYGEVSEARSKCFAPVPNHPARRAELLHSTWKIQSFSVQLMKTVYAKSNTMDKSKKREQAERTNSNR